MKIFLFSLAFLVVLLPLISGCAPAPPPSPFIGSIGFFLIGWVLLGLIALIITIVWKKEGNTSGKTKYLTDAINDINERLKTLENKIDKITGGDDNKRM